MALVNTPGETIRSHDGVNLLNSFFPSELHNPVVCNLLVPLQYGEAEIVTLDISRLRSSYQEGSWKVGRYERNSWY